MMDADRRAPSSPSSQVRERKIFNTKNFELALALALDSLTYLGILLVLLVLVLLVLVLLVLVLLVLVLLVLVLLVLVLLVLVLLVLVVLDTSSIFRAEKEEKKGSSSSTTSIVKTRQWMLMGQLPKSCLTNCGFFIIRPC